ncbi:MAG: helix-turn-helix domain-containing protein [Candidatus Pristimantibacillus sp.]
MASLKKKEGFQAEKLFVLPDYVLKEIAEHALIRSLYISDIGYFPHAKDHYRERSEGCDSNIFIYCANGQGWIELDGERKVAMTAHSFFVIPAGTPHRYGADEDLPWSIYWFHFKGEDASAFINSFGLSSSALQIPLSSFMKFAELFEQCYELLAAKTYSLPHHIQVAQSMRHLISMIGLAASRPRQEERRELYMEQAIQYMTEHLNAPITLPDLARHTGLSKQHLIHLFNEATGYPPIDYFLRLKMQRASQMLDLSEMSVKEIGSAVGLHDPYYFSRLFKKIMGCSPTEYRKIQKG